MLPKIEVVRRAIEKLHQDTAIIYTNYDEMDKETGIMTEKTLESEPIPCRLSYNSKPSADGDTLQSATQTITLFLAPEVKVIAGSDIDIIRRGQRLKFKAAGIPALYDSHQEITLEERVKYHGENDTGC